MRGETSPTEERAHGLQDGLLKCSSARCPEADAGCHPLFHTSRPCEANVQVHSDTGPCPTAVTKKNYQV